MLDPAAPPRDPIWARSKIIILALAVGQIGPLLRNCSSDSRVRLVAGAPVEMRSTKKQIFDLDGSRKIEACPRIGVPLHEKSDIESSPTSLLSLGPLESQKLWTQVTQVILK